MFTSNPLNNTPVAGCIELGSDKDGKVAITSTPSVQYHAPTSTSNYSSSSGNRSNISRLHHLMQLDCTIPDSVANHCARVSGFEPSDPRVVRLLSLAAEKFIYDVVSEAFANCELMGRADQKQNTVKDKRYTLTMNELIPVLNDHGITIRKPPYYT